MVVVDSGAIRRFLARETEVYLPAVAKAGGRNFDALSDRDRSELGNIMALAGWTKNKRTDLWSAPGRLRTGV